jgi:hypothetical protein
MPITNNPANEGFVQKNAPFGAVWGEVNQADWSLMGSSSRGLLGLELDELGK